MLSLSAATPSIRLTDSPQHRRSEVLPCLCQRRSDCLMRSVTLCARCDSADGRFDELLPS
ncbi:hypothetical protein LINPERHAP2_LOCUS32594 [Linum perenne]